MSPTAGADHCGLFTETGQRYGQPGSASPFRSKKLTPTSDATPASSHESPSRSATTGQVVLVKDW